MRFLLLLALLVPATLPAVAQEIGDRTASPRTHLPAGALAPGQDDLEAAIRAAEAHPLGTLANPIRVGGPEGERAYLARLRCPGGAAPNIGPRSEGGVDAYGTLAGAYDVACGAAATRLVFDMYHEEHVEVRAPVGFTLTPR